jgi:glycosyltransferase involved in cell wall biosynthesis
LEPLKTKVAKTEYPSLLYLGRLKDYKNVDIAIKAFAKLHKSTPKAIFNIAGEGECKAELKKLVKVLDLEDSVNFLGRVSDEERTNLYATSWLMVQPSSHEGWGITVIEANFYGCPVVASDISGLRDSVVNGKTGILVKPKSVIGFTKAILKVFKSQSLREKMSTLGIERAKKFNWSENTDIFLSAIHHYYLNIIEITQ